MKSYLIMFLICSLSTSYGITVFDDGYEHDIDYTIEDSVYIQNDSFWNYPTTVNILSGGVITMAITPWEDSNLNIIGGEISSISGRDNSNILIKSGGISGSINLYTYSNLIIEGGTLNIFQFCLHHYSSLFIHNGALTFEGLNIEDSSSATIYGTNFNINGRPVQSGTYTDSSGVLTGILIGGDAINIPFKIYAGGSLILSPESVPFCTQYPTMDFNRDCYVNLLDFAEFASQWMVCNLEPQSYCF